MRAVPTPQIPCVFSGKMRLAFLVLVNSYDTRPTALGFRIFFHLKRASQKPFQIPCVFSSKTRLALNVIAKFIWLAADRSHIPCFFQRKRTLQESGHVPQVHFHCVFSGTMCLGFTSQCEFTCDVASPCRILFLFPRENAPRRNHQEAWKKDICWPRSFLMCVSKGKKVTLRQAFELRIPKHRKEINFQEKICGNGG